MYGLWDQCLNGLGLLNVRNSKYFSVSLIALNFCCSFTPPKASSICTGFLILPLESNRI